MDSKITFFKDMEILLTAKHAKYTHNNLLYINSKLVDNL